MIYKECSRVGCKNILCSKIANFLMCIECENDFIEFVEKGKRKRESADFLRELGRFLKTEKDTVVRETVQDFLRNMRGKGETS